MLRAAIYGYVFLCCSAFFRFSRSFTQFRSSSGCCWFILLFRFHSFFVIMLEIFNQTVFRKIFFRFFILVWTFISCERYFETDHRGRVFSGVIKKILTIDWIKICEFLKFYRELEISIVFYFESKIENLDKWTLKQPEIVLQNINKRS